MEVTKETVLKAWKDEEFRAGLPEDVRSAIPARPTAEGGGELSDSELETAAGGTTPLGAIPVAVEIAGGTAAAGGFAASFSGALSD